MRPFSAMALIVILSTPSFSTFGGDKVGNGDEPRRFQLSRIAELVPTLIEQGILGVRFQGEQREMLLRMGALVRARPLTVIERLGNRGGCDANHLGMAMAIVGAPIYISLGHDEHLDGPSDAAITAAVIHHVGHQAGIEDHQALDAIAFSLTAGF